MAKEEYVIDLFFGEYMGGKARLENSDNYPGRKQPVVKKMKTHPSQLLKPGKKEEFPYALDPEENIERIEGEAGFPIIILKPTANVPDLTKDQFEKTIWRHLKENEEKDAEHWREKYREKKKELETKKKDLKALRERTEEERKQKSSSSASNNVTCPACDSSNPESKWRDNNGFCPSCGNKKLEEVKG